MLHPRRVLKEIKGNATRQTRIWLGIKARPKTPILSRPVEEIINFHSLICRRLKDLWPTNLDITNESVCEIGPGDCLASTAFFIAKGASHVDSVEIQPPVVNQKQADVLEALKMKGFPISLDVITGGSVPSLNEKLVTYHKQHMEDYHTENRHGFIFSHNVMEHVEDVEKVFSVAFRALRPDGRMFHVIDLGGHGEFEDPLPPLDFQTYPDWLYGCMYPVHHRATRRFVADYQQAALAAGFRSVNLQPLRTADETYLEAIHKKLRPAARKQTREDISVIEFVLDAVK